MSTGAFELLPHQDNKAAETDNTAQASASLTDPSSPKPKGTDVLQAN